MNGQTGSGTLLPTTLPQKFACSASPTRGDEECKILQTAFASKLVKTLFSMIMAIFSAYELLMFLKPANF